VTDYGRLGGRGGRTGGGLSVCGGIVSGGIVSGGADVVVLATENKQSRVRKKKDGTMMIHFSSDFLLCSTKSHSILREKEEGRYLGANW
jgi:hypothetical protein